MESKVNLSDIFYHNLCTGCGTCVAVCPTKAISLVENLPGILKPEVELRNCSNCGLCTDICPGIKVHNMGVKYADPFRGEVLKAYVGFATDLNIRKTAQSGGIATALLAHQLNEKRIDFAIVSRMRQDGSLRPFPYMAHSEEELYDSQGSLYCQVPVNSKLADIHKDSKVGVIGLPCHVHGITNLKATIESWHNKLPVVIGLFCDRTLFYSAMDYLVKKGNLDRNNVSHFKYRDRSNGNFPGNISIVTNDGQSHYLPFKYRMECKDAFTPIRCRLCFDKMNTQCDIAIGDAWGVQEDKEGYSVILARTNRGLKVLENARQSKTITLFDIDPENVFKGQNISKKREEFSAYTHVWERLGNITPDFTLKNLMHTENMSSSHISTSEKEIKWILKIMRQKSINRIVWQAKKKIILEKINKLGVRYFRQIF